MTLHSDVSWIFWQVIQRSQMLRGSFAILTYHRVAPADDHAFLQLGSVPFVSPAVFADQVALLASGGFVVMALDEALRRRARGQSFAARTIAITFDDGYLDNLAAARVLHRAGLPATVFVATRCLARTELLFEHRLFLALERFGAERTHGLLRDLAPAGARTRFVEHLRLQVPGPRRQEAHERLGRAFRDAGLDEAALCRTLYLAPDQLAELRELGVAIGCHGARHFPWTTLSADERRGDLAEAQQRLRDALGDAAAPLFASPYGSHGAGDRGLLRDAGVQAAVTTRFGSNGRSTDPLLLRRIAIGDSSAHRLRFLQRSSRVARWFDVL